MKCDQCVSENKTSKVYDRGTSKQMLGHTPWYDEGGNYHVHGNLRRTYYTCSNGHGWEVKWRPPCPTCGVLAV